VNHYVFTIGLIFIIYFIFQFIKTKKYVFLYNTIYPVLVIFLYLPFVNLQVNLRATLVVILLLINISGLLIYVYFNSK